MATKLNSRNGHKSVDTRNCSLKSEEELLCHICGDNDHLESECELYNILFKCVLCREQPHPVIECPLLERLERATQQQLLPRECIEWKTMSSGQQEVSGAVQGLDPKVGLGTKCRTGQTDEWESWDEIMIPLYEEFY